MEMEMQKTRGVNQPNMRRDKQTSYTDEYTVHEIEKSAGGLNFRS
jgi:hypothetical protein